MTDPGVQALVLLLGLPGPPEGGAGCAEGVQALLAGDGERGLETDRYGNPLPGGHPLRGRLLDPPVDEAARRLLASWREERRARGLPQLRALPWPGGAPYAVALSHDVDDPLKGQLLYGLLLAASGLLKGVPAARREGLARAGAWARVRRGEPDPYFTFGAIREAEAAEGVRSTFFAVPILDGDWEVRVGACEEPLRSALREAAAEGWEVGVHGSNASAGDGGRLRAERLALESALGRPVGVLRQHNLRWGGPESWGRMRAAGFTCDSSVGFNGAPGYRSGSSFPVLAPGGLVEIPHVLMDTYEDGGGGLEAVFAAVRRTGGIATLNWHERAFCEADFPGRAQRYRGALRTARADGAWIVPVGEAGDWWRRRASLRWNGEAVEAPEGISGLVLRDEERGRLLPVPPLAPGEAWRP